MINGDEIINESIDRCFLASVYDNRGGVVSSTSKIIFDTIITNENNCYDTSTGYYTCPVDGMYLCCFVFYGTNSTGTTGDRMVILKNDLMIHMTNGPCGKPLTCCVYCSAGDRLSAGAPGGYSVNYYAAFGHNIFTVCKID